VRRKGGSGASVLQSYFVAIQPRRCPLCGAESLVLDFERGQLVCTSCGYVVDDTVFIYTGYEHAGANYRPPLREESTVVRARRTRLSIVSTRTRLTTRLGVKAASIIEDMSIDPLAAQEALTLLKNPCVRRLLKRLDSDTTAALIKALVAYKRSGEYPLYSELVLEYNLDEKESRRLRKALRKAIDCISEANDATLPPQKMR